MLAVATCERLRQAGVEARQVEEFSSGVKLLQLVCQAFYAGDNPALSAKIKWSDDQKTGNKVVNVNTILNFIKKDPALSLPPHVRELTAFRLIEEPQAMTAFVEYLLSCITHTHHNPPNTAEMSPPRQQQNQFDNLYFAASIGKNPHYHSDDSLEAERETVVRKGSFKVLKPKLSSDAKSKTSSNKEHPQDATARESEPAADFKMEPLREIYVLDHDNQQEEPPRKTVPRMHERPPLCRSRQKEEKEEKRVTPMATASQTDREALARNLDTLNGQIAEEERSLQLLNSSATTKPEPVRRSSRKIFKAELPEIGEAKKKALAEWLIGINILAVGAAKHALTLHSICKDGVLFMEVLNYYRGRGRALCYFREPRRPAEMHSNYQKLFTLLAECPDFRSELTHRYEFFVPEAQPNAFWGLLAAIHTCFSRVQRHKDPAVDRYDSAVSRSVERSRPQASSSLTFQQVRYNSDSAHRDREAKSNFSSVELPRKETPQPTPAHKPTGGSRKSEESEARAAAFGLVQNEDPAEDNQRSERGYRELYLSKFKNIQTPSKNRSFSNNSLSRSRLRSSGSAHKRDRERERTAPSISLEMQMAVLRYLGTLGVEEQDELFRDPYRNGVLLCSIIAKEWAVDCFAARRPRSIDDCRNNFLTAIEVVRSRRKALNVTYEYFVEELVKGERSLLYGLVWHIIREEGPQAQPSAQLEEPEGRPRVEEQRVGWVRAIEKHSADIAALKIRSEEALYSAVLGGDFLFHYAAVITGKRAVTPNYERAFNAVQRESNLKKALSYFVQHKIIRSDYLGRARTMLNRQGNALQELLNDLITHFNRLFAKEQHRTVNFVRYVRREDREEPKEGEREEKPQEKLETTMANQTVLPAVAAPALEVNWVRRLGFSGSLELNDGVLLCRLVAKLAMRTVEGVKERPQSRAECLGNIRRAIKLLPKFKWDEYDIAEADSARTLEVYAFLREQFKHSYALKSLL